MLKSGSSTTVFINLNLLELDRSTNNWPFLCRCYVVIKFESDNIPTIDPFLYCWYFVQIDFSDERDLFTYIQSTVEEMGCTDELAALLQKLLFIPTDNVFGDSMWNLLLERYQQLLSLETYHLSMQTRILYCIETCIQIIFWGEKYVLCFNISILRAKPSWFLLLLVANRYILCVTWGIKSVWNRIYDIER